MKRSLNVHQLAIGPPPARENYLIQSAGTVGVVKRYMPIQRLQVDVTFDSLFWRAFLFARRSRGRLTVLTRHVISPRVFVCFFFVCLLRAVRALH